MALNGLIEEKFGVEPQYFRPGYGQINKTVYDMLTDAEMPAIWCDKGDIGDYNTSTTSEYIEETVLSIAGDGAIILLHRQSYGTAGAIENICKKLYDQGYRFVTLGEMFKFKGIDPDEFATMSDSEQREALEEAGLDPDDYDF